MIVPEVSSFIESAKDCVFDCVKEILGLTDAQANKMIRFSWPTSAGSNKFAATPTTDVLYVRMETIPNAPGTGYLNGSYAPGSKEGTVLKSINTHIMLRVTFIFYGPHGNEYANRLYVGFQCPEILDIMEPYNMATIPFSGMPTPIPELVDGNWYERNDISVPMYMEIQYAQELDELSPPVIITKQN